MHLIFLCLLSIVQQGQGQGGRAGGTALVQELAQAGPALTGAQVDHRLTETDPAKQVTFGD